MFFSQTGSLFMPVEASTFAPGVDWLFYFVFWLSTFFFVLVVGMMTFFVVRYRRRDNEIPTGGIHHNTLLEVAWSVIPSFLVIFIFAVGFDGYMDMRSMPQNAYEIHVDAVKWRWTFRYPNGYTSPNLHLPANRPVRMILNSGDVLHSLFIPAFRAKMDVVPGRYTDMWVQATLIGEFPVYCAEYCGASDKIGPKGEQEGHSYMRAKAIVHPDGEFDAYLEKAMAELMSANPEEYGAYLYQGRCSGCHSVDGSLKAGPSFKGGFGKEHEMVGGRKIKMDENYIRRSILEPMADVRAGFNPVMPSFKGQLNDLELNALIAYIKSLRDK